MLYCKKMCTILSRHWEKTNEAIFFFIDTFLLARTGVWQKNVITTRSGVKKYAGWCTRIPKSSSDDPFLTLFYFSGIFLIRLLAVPGQYKLMGSYFTPFEFEQWSIVVNSGEQWSIVAYSGEQWSVVAKSKQKLKYKQNPYIK